MAPLGPYWLLRYLHRRQQCGRTLDNLTATCAAGNVKRVLIDAKNLLYTFQFNWLALDVGDADRALRRFVDNFPKTELIFAFHDAGPKDLEFTGVRSHDEKISRALMEMQTTRALRDGHVRRNTSVPAPLFLTEWLIARVTEMGFRAVAVEGWADRWQQLAILAKEYDCDFLLAASPDFLLFDMGAASYISAREPYGDGPTTIHHSAHVADALGLPLDGVRELSCLMGNHHITQAHLEGYHAQVCNLNGGLPRDRVVDALIKLVRLRWSDGQTHELHEQVAFVHETTGLKMKLVRQALEFYQTDAKANVFPVAWPPSRDPGARAAYAGHLQYREAKWFGETRLAAQFGDVVVRRDRVLQPLREFQYGLLVLFPRVCDPKCEQANSPTVNVIEHRMDFGECDDIVQVMVEPKLPEFVFGNGREKSAKRLSDRPLYEAFFDPLSLEFGDRAAFYLHLFEANTAWIKALPEGLIPAAAALRYLMQVDLPGVDLGGAVSAFVTHLAVLQHGNVSRFVEDFDKHDNGALDELAYGYFFLIYHALYAAVVEMHGMCNFPFPEVARFDKLWNYRVFEAIYNRGAALTPPEASVEAPLRRAVMHDTKKHISIDLAAHGSVWVPKETSYIPMRKLSLPWSPKRGQCEVRDGSVSYQRDTNDNVAAPTSGPARRPSFGVAPGTLPQAAEQLQLQQQRLGGKKMPQTPPQKGASPRRAPHATVNQLLQRNRQRQNPQQQQQQQSPVSHVQNAKGLDLHGATRSPEGFGRGKTLADHLDPRVLGCDDKKAAKPLPQSPQASSKLISAAVGLTMQKHVGPSLADQSMSWRGGGKNRRPGVPQ